jgi:hypothetical protein
MSRKGKDRMFHASHVVLEVRKMAKQITIEKFLWALLAVYLVDPYRLIGAVGHLYPLEAVFFVDCWLGVFLVGVIDPSSRKPSFCRLFLILPILGCRASR